MNINNHLLTAKNSLFLVLGLLFLGCYEEDIILPLPDDEGLIIAAWEGNLITYLAQDGSTIFWDEFYCDGNIMMTCYADGRLWYADFVPKADVDNYCIEDTITKQNGTWRRIATGAYEFYLQNGVDDSEIVISPEKITFSGPEQEAKTMDIHYKERPKNGPKNAVSYYRTVFKRE